MSMGGGDGNGLDRATDEAYSAVRSESLEVPVIPFHRFRALATLACTVCLAALVAVFTDAPPLSALRGTGDVRSSVGSVVGAAYAADAVLAIHASPGHIYLPLLSNGHPLAVCRGGMSRFDAVEHARIESYMMGLRGPSGDRDFYTEVVAALRMTAAEHDVGFPEDGSLLEDVFPVGPPWICYWRIELRGEGVLQAGRPGSGPFRINRSMELFPAETCDDCIGGMGSYWWEDEGTPGVGATGTASPDDPTPTGPRPSSTPSATARVWPSPTPSDP